MDLTGQHMMLLNHVVCLFSKNSKKVNINIYFMRFGVKDKNKIKEAGFYILVDETNDKRRKTRTICYLHLCSQWNY